jgi:hypothetical protein
MSDEQRDDEIEVEGHGARPGENDEPVEDAEDDFEAHHLRMD